MYIEKIVLKQVIKKRFLEENAKLWFIILLKKNQQQRQL